MRGLIILVLLCFIIPNAKSQVIELKKWCVSQCDIAGDEKKNAEFVYMVLRNDSIRRNELTGTVLRFPLRIGIVRSDTTELKIDELAIKQAIANLNNTFQPAGVVFYIDRVDLILSDLYIEDLSKNTYEPYNVFSDRYDVEDMISVYIFDHGHEFCTTSITSIRCGRTGGFSYILSERTKSLVLSTFDITDQKIVTHEFGHFFGLYHTFEEAQFGKDNFGTDVCKVVGDGICDTPPDPGGIFEIYINYSLCEMFGLKHDNGMEYKPMIENFMSYYKPCYLTEYEFTSGQYDVIRLAANCNLRVHLSR